MSLSNCGPNRVRDFRQTHGWSQAELAERVGISRAGISAIEGNRLVPSVAAALALARVFNTTVEVLFGACFESGRTNDTLWAWQPFSFPCRYLTAEVDNRVLHFPTELSAGIPPGHDGIAKNKQIESVPSDLSRRTLVIATCDPAAGYLAVEYERQTPFRMLVFNRPSRQALDLLEQGVVHVAGVHLADREAAGGNAAAIQAIGIDSQLTLLGVADWEEGVAISPTLKVRTIRHAIDKRMRWVGRPSGAGARRCQDALLSQRRPPQRIAHDHRSVISSIRSGYADLGICPRFVAEEGHVGFLSVCIEAYDLCFRADTIDDPRVAALVQVVKSPSYRDTLDTLPGYHRRRRGEIVRLPRPGVKP